jgi:hypothetical protein
MTPASLLLAALAAWGPVAPAADSGSEPAREPFVPTAAAVPSAPPPPVVRTTIDPDAAPALLAAPSPSPPPPRTPTYKRWQFWVIAGGAFAAAVGLTIAVTRPGPEPYSGNAPPYLISFH